jgi:uncharacterized protein YueI
MFGFNLNTTTPTYFVLTSHSATNIFEIWLEKYFEKTEVLNKRH